MQFIIKTLISAVIISAVSELGKRLTPVAAILASLPITSILAMVWLYRDTGDIQKITDLSYGIFWAVLPSLLFFLVLPFSLKVGLKFGLALVVSSLVMSLGYGIYVIILGRLGIKI